MRLFKEVPITSAEQAEALPLGTVAFAHTPLRGDCYTKYDFDNWEGARRGLGSPDASMVGWTALVPIEAEEEWTAIGEDEDGAGWIAHVCFDGLDGTREDAEGYVRAHGGSIAHHAITPWEAE